MRGVQVMRTVTVVGPDDRRVYIREAAASDAAAGNSRVSATVHTSEKSRKHKKQKQRPESQGSPTTHDVP